jgi:outer membrane biosynthesis protein TonB
MVEAVIDTTGRAERQSIRGLSTTNPLFRQPAVEVVAAAVYRPGRINGRAVRVRVQLPIDFQVAAGGTTM